MKYSLIFLIFIVSCNTSPIEENTKDTADTLIKEFFDNGNIKRLVIHSKASEYYNDFYYYESGVIHWKGHRDTNGLMSGLWKEYSTQENLISSVEYIIVDNQSIKNNILLFEISGDTLLGKSNFAESDILYDTLNYGDTNALYVNMIPLYGENLALLLGDFDSNYSNRENIPVDTIWMNDYFLIHEFIPKKKGKNILRAILIDVVYENTEKTQGKTRMLFVEEEFYVK